MNKLIMIDQKNRRNHIDLKLRIYAIIATIYVSSIIALVITS